MTSGLVAVQWVLLAMIVLPIVALIARGVRRQPAPAGAETGAEVAGDIEWWRCNSCGLRWRTRGARHVSTLRLRAAQRVRRNARAAKRPVPEWAKPRGSDRCPSCLSQSIRPSRRQEA